MSVHWLWPVSAVTSFVLTWAVIRFAGNRQLIDLPNERSSHDRPVPRGGGIAIVLTFLAGMIGIEWLGIVDERMLAAVLGGGGGVALVGLVDDYRDVSPSRRLLSQSLAAVWALYWLGGIPDDILPGVPTALLNVLGVVCVVWFINLYNFMDGIDGIASIETVTVCLAAVVLYGLRISDEPAWIPPALLLASVSGFMIWNLPPARIFLGDSGSGFIGFVAAVFCIQAARFAPAFFWAWLILLGVFIVDSGMTLIRRMLRRQRVYDAHRSHGYQFAARKYGGHAPVSLAVGAINVVWLLPLAWLAATGRTPALPTLLVAYAPLVWLGFHFKSGAPEQQET